MVKNIPTIERSTKIRFGKHANDNQAENTVVFNASDAPISASTPGSLYVTPVRVAELSGANFFAYHAQTAELVDSGVATDLLGGITLENATTVGNVTANTVEFNNATTSLVASSNVGISNTLPTHALSVADKVFIKGPVGDTDDLRIVGNTRTDRLSTTGNSVVIDKDNTNKIQVSGIIHTGDIQATSHVAIANTNPQNLFTLGAVGQTVMNVPTQSVFAIETTGNINAQYYRGDGGLLSNVTLQTVTDKSNVTSNTLHLTNPTTSLKAYSNIVVDDYIFGNISGSNLITASEITALGDIQGQTITGTQGVYDQIVTNQDILADKLVGTTGIYGEILGSNNITASKVSGILYGEIVGSNNIASSGIYGEILGSNNITASVINASSFSGDGSSITNIDTGNINLGVLPVAHGGTSINTYSEGDLVYASGITSLAKLSTSSATAGQFLKLNAGKTAPEWSDVPLTLDEVLASQTGVSNVSDEVITLNKSSGVALEVTSGQVALNGSGVVLDAPIGEITASTFTGAFSGNGSNISELNLGQGTNTGQVPITRGGTGASSLNTLSIPYVNNSGIFEESKIEYNPSTHITSISSNVVVSGNLHVDGNLTAQHTTDHFIVDKIFAVAHNNTVDAKDMGQHMTRPTANIFAGFLGQTIGKEYTIAFTESASDGHTVIPTNTTADGYITANVWGNVLSGNVTTTGTVTADKLIVSGATGIDANNSIVNALSVNAGNFYGGNFSGNGSGLEALNASNVSTGTLATARGGTGVTTGLTVLDPANLSSQVLLAKGGTGLTSVAQNELLLGPASGTALDTLPPYAPVSTIEYPTSALSSAANSGETIAGVTYTTTASSNQYGEIWRAFDKTTPGHNTFWHSNENVYDSTSGAYTGSNSLGGVSGEWIKLQLSTGITPTSVNITGRTGYDNQAPDSWEILGSTNNSSWTSLLSSTVHATYNGGSGHTVSISGASAYTYLALVAKARGGTGQTAVVLSEVRFFTANPNPAKRFLRSSAAGIDWDEVSSDLQTITDGGATTTQTVAFNNTTTGLTSAGDIDIADTKQIDYAGDVLLKSSAGTVASLKVTNAVKLDPAYASPSNNVLSFNTTTGEIYDSGGQGGSTLDNVHEYKANISIGPSVAAANLTINVFESNVLTVSGNVSADSITIGALHVAASPFNLDDVASAGAGANVTSNVIQFTGPHSSYNSDNAFVTTNSIKIGSNVNVTGNLISQNIQLTNPGITASMSSTDTITIDAKNKSYGTAPLVQLAGDLNSLVYSDLIDGAQVVVPIFASGADRKISKNLTNVNWYVQTSDLTIKQSEHGLMTLSNVAGNVYMNSISFTQN